MNDSFWPDCNAWWRLAIARMLSGEASGSDWQTATRWLWRIAGRLSHAQTLGDETRADLVQSVLLRLLKRRVQERLAVQQAPAQYLRRMIRNRLIDEHRRQALAPEVIARHAQEVPRSVAESPDVQVKQKELVQQALFALRHLISRESREVLTWYYLQDWSVERIARRLRLQPGTVYQRLFRARREVHDALGW